MESDNATNFTAEIAQELMKASQETKVPSTLLNREAKVSLNAKTEKCLLCYASTHLGGCWIEMRT